MFAICAIARVGKRSTTQRVFGTRISPCTGSRYLTEWSVCFPAGTSACSARFMTALTPM